jgi:hypothetical protein
MRSPIRYVWLLVALLLGACEASRVPTEPGPDPEHKLKLQTVTVNGVHLLVGDPAGRSLSLADDDDDDDDDDDFGARYIRRNEGGKVEIDDAELRIPKYSIARSATVTMSRSPNTQGVLTLRFEPSGMTFSPAAKLIIDLDDLRRAGVDVSRIRVAGAPNDSEAWEVLPGRLRDGGREIVIDVPHFSRYALCVN